MLSRGIIGIAFSGGAGVALRRAFTTQSLSLDTLNPNVRKMEYAVRGKILIEAMNIHEDMLKVAHGVYYVTECNYLLDGIVESTQISVRRRGICEYW
jgi:hypothetical protein